MHYILDILAKKNITLIKNDKISILGEYMFEEPFRNITGGGGFPIFVCEIWVPPSKNWQNLGIPPRIGKFCQPPTYFLNPFNWVLLPILGFFVN